MIIPPWADPPHQNPSNSPNQIHQTKKEKKISSVLKTSNNCNYGIDITTCFSCSQPRYGNLGRIHTTNTVSICSKVNKLLKLSVDLPSHQACLSSLTWRVEVSNSNSTMAGNNLKKKRKCGWISVKKTHATTIHNG
jgi:hypothetical protein